MKLPALLLLLCASTYGADIRIGIIGTDTSHVIAFTKALNDPANKDHIPGARIVAAFKGGSKDLPDSFNRVDKYAEELKTVWNIEMVPDIETLCKKVDAVLQEVQGVGANVKAATADLAPLRADVEANLRKIETLINEINRKWPFARDTEIKLP